MSTTILTDAAKEAVDKEIAAAPELLAELQHAHQIILNAVAIMTPEQKSAWAQANERDGCNEVRRYGGQEQKQPGDGPDSGPIRMRFHRECSRMTRRTT